MEMLTVQLVKGQTCNDPGTGQSIDGTKPIKVPALPYWQERIKEGVLELVAEPPAQKPAAQAKAKPAAKSGD